MIVRRAVEHDIRAATAIYAYYVLHSGCTFETDPPDLSEMQRRWSAVVNAGLPYLVAELEGEVIGYAYAAPYRPRPAYRFTVEDSIYVAPSSLRQGAGASLLNELIRECSALGFRQMIAVVGDSANTASVTLHERFGFRHAGIFEKVGFKFDRWLDTVLMQRALP